MSEKTQNNNLQNVEQTPTAMSPPPDQSPASQPLGVSTSPKTLKNTKKLAVIGIIVLLLGIGLYTVLSNTKDDTNKTTTTQPKPITSFAAVSTTDTGFMPATITVKAGTQLTWTNTSTKQYHIKAGPYPSGSSNPALDSQEPLAKGDSYSFVFEETGTYNYVNQLEPLKNQGVVVVN